MKKFLLSLIALVACTVSTFAANEEMAFIYVDANADLVKVTSQSTRNTVTLYENSEVQVQTGTYQINGVNGFTPYKVTLNGKEVNGNGYWMVTLGEGDKLNIITTYPKDRYALTVNSMEAIKNVTVNYNGSNVDWTDYFTPNSMAEGQDPTYSAPIPAGYKATINFDTNNYFNIKVNGSAKTSYTTAAMSKDLTLKITAEKIVDLNAKLFICDPNVATVHKGGDYRGETLSLVAGENAFSVRSNNKNIVIVPASKDKELTVTVNGVAATADASTGYFTITVADGDVIYVAPTATAYTVNPEDGSTVSAISTVTFTFADDDAVVDLKDQNSAYLLKADGTKIENVLYVDWAEYMNQFEVKYTGTTALAAGTYTIVVPAGALTVDGSYTFDITATYTVAPSTGINTINANENSSVRYNLAGQRVNANAKGIVIMNGKKFLQK